MVPAELGSTCTGAARTNATDEAAREPRTEAPSRETWWLRGVTWPLLAMVLLIACMQNAPQVARALFFHSEDGRKPWEVVAFDLVDQVAVGVAIVVLAAVLRNLPRPRIPLPLALALSVLLGTFAVVNGIAYLFNGADIDLVYANMQARRIIVPWAIAAVAWYFLQRADSRAAALRATQISQRRLEATMVEARLQALQAQVEPHFLFNTLAHVRRLYRVEPVRARLMLDSFRAYLRSALPQMRDAAATLGGEADLARAYLDVQQVRMGRRLAVAIEVPAALRERPFPAMMLLSLVANAIKHGLNALPDGGRIAVAAGERDGMLQVTVTDTGRGMGEQIGSGVGLANIRSRLAAHYGAAASLALSPNPPHGVRAVIRVPSGTVARDRTRDDEVLTHGA